MAATTNGDEASAGQDDLSKQLPPGTILPPRNARDNIEKVAAYVARNGKAFEDKVRQNQPEKMSFVLEEDPYHAYYRWRVDECKAQRGFDESANKIAAAKKGDVTFQGGKSRAPPPPPDFQFSARMPNISAQDLEIVKLTALYAAKNGRSWMTQLSQREAGNFQFDFLRPQHSLNMYFNRLMEQYKDLIEGETVDQGAPQKKRIAELKTNCADRFNVLQKAKKRAEYVKYQEKQKVEKEEKEEKDRIAFAQIDWHDFSVVQTITFDERDEAAELPPPRTKNDMLSMSLEQKASMRIDPNRRLEEAMPTMDDYSDFYGQPAPTPAAQMPTPQAYTPQDVASTTPSQQSPYAPPAIPSIQEERDRVRAAAKANAQQTRVRTDYVPQAQLRNRAQNTSICPMCKQSIPNDEIDQHMRIEALSPEWREQMAKNQQRSSTTNLSTADVANNLKRLASQRTDLFDPVTGQSLTQEEQERRKRAELQAYDGISQVPNAAALGQMGQQQQQGAPGAHAPGMERPDVQGQIKYLHDKYKK